MAILHIHLRKMHNYEYFTDMLCVHFYLGSLFNQKYLNSQTYSIVTHSGAKCNTFFTLTR